ncbi:putative serine/threonine protein kinase [Blattamonas nauphoetae]|uniref:non-specific serine/threonine protein kinase n=1 Tax=Blattamonas nauphoetae TaxID=2049346 RepID=A0ABQ9Y9G6_9EUKA|nr:putative serine/threonine protein kinase [Blattamonas nauphoetae]
MAFPSPTERKPFLKCKIDFDQESKEDYRNGGYHEVFIGDVLNQQYKVCHKLGWGHFSTVWLCEILDSRRSPFPNKFVAIKIVRSQPNYTKAAKEEISMLKTITECDKENSNHVSHLLDFFSVTGRNGTHHCLVFETLGLNILNLLRLYDPTSLPQETFSVMYRTFPRIYGVPQPIVKLICIQTLRALHYLHSPPISLIHTDLKPENILLEWPVVFCIDDRQGIKNADAFFGDCNPDHDIHRHSKFKKYRIKLSDFGNSIHSPESGMAVLEKGPHAHSLLFQKPPYPPHRIQTRQYRAPESILGCTPSPGTDLWSFGCMAFELVTGRVLFNPRGKGEGDLEWNDGYDDQDDNSAYDRDDDHLTLVKAILHTDPPEKLLNAGFWSEDLFDIFTRQQRRGIKRKERELADLIMGWTKVEKELIIQQKQIDINQPNARELIYPTPVLQFEAFLLKCLTWSPVDRYSAFELLNDDWLKLTTDDYEFDGLNLIQSTTNPPSPPKRPKHRYQSGFDLARLPVRAVDLSGIVDLPWSEQTLVGEPDIGMHLDATGQKVPFISGPPEEVAPSEVQTLCEEVSEIVPKMDNRLERLVNLLSNKSSQMEAKESEMEKDEDEHRIVKCNDDKSLSELLPALLKQKELLDRVLPLLKRDEEKE